MKVAQLQAHLRAVMRCEGTVDDMMRRACELGECVVFEVPRRFGKTITLVRLAAALACGERWVEIDVITRSPQFMLLIYDALSACRIVMPFIKIEMDGPLSRVMVGRVDVWVDPASAPRRINMYNALLPRTSATVTLMDIPMSEAAARRVGAVITMVTNTDGSRYPRIRRVMMNQPGSL